MVGWFREYDSLNTEYRGDFPERRKGRCCNETSEDSRSRTWLQVGICRIGDAVSSRQSGDYFLFSSSRHEKSLKSRSCPIRMLAEQNNGFMNIRRWLERWSVVPYTYRASSLTS